LLHVVYGRAGVPSPLESPRAGMSQSAS
jgi:hypothetical protein